MSQTLEPLMDRAAFELAAPAIVTALRAITQAVEAGGMDKSLIELIKVRTSQLNGCAFCLQFHLNIARKLGVPMAKLDLVATWREAAIYSPRERAALGWAESLTLMARGPIEAAAEAALCAEFDANEIALLTSSIATINAWNRIAGSLRFAPPAAA